MPTLEKRIEKLETARGTGLEALTDDELETRIAELEVRIAEWVTEENRINASSSTEVEKVAQDTR